MRRPISDAPPVENRRLCELCGLVPLRLAVVWVEDHLEWTGEYQMLYGVPAHSLRCLMEFGAACWHSGMRPARRVRK